mmetsp:Transcript_39137/g.96944  ORF Transcript_39137/g.96944 Transcript_39137/m.96944 type:complete len:238 (+) Transcript_39137:165-878(+)
MVLVRGRRCAMLRRYSSVWRFFCSGKVLASAGPTTRMDSVDTSTACLPPMDTTTVPSMMTAAPVVTCPSATSAAPSAVSVTTAWMPLRLEPSLTSTKDSPFCSRTVRTHPRSCTLSPTRDMPPSVPLMLTMRSCLLNVRVLPPAVEAGAAVVDASPPAAAAVESVATTRSDAPRATPPPPLRRAESSISDEPDDAVAAWRPRRPAAPAPLRTTARRVMSAMVAAVAGECCARVCGCC